MRLLTARALLMPAGLVAGLLLSCSSGTDNNSNEPDIEKMVITVIDQPGTAGNDYAATDATNGFAGATATVIVGLFKVQSTFFRPNRTRESSLSPQDFATAGVLQRRIAGAAAGHQL